MGSELDAILTERARDTPSWPFLLQPGHDDLTVGELERAVSALAVELVRADIGPGDVVALSLPADDLRSLAVAIFATLRVGGRPATFSPTWSSEYKLRVAQDLAVAGVLGEGLCFTPAPRRRTRLLGQEPDAPGLVVFTSGASGRVAALFASEGNFLGRVIGGDTSDVRSLVPLGVCSAAAETLVILLRLGVTLVAVPSQSASAVADAIAHYQAHIVTQFPHIALALVRRGLHRERDMSSLYEVQLTGTHAPPELPAALAQALPHVAVTNYYSSTEAAPAGTLMRFGEHPVDSVGKPRRQTEVLVTDARGTPVGPGGSGDVWLREPTVPPRLPLSRRPAAGLEAQGWVRTGDVGRLDDDGNLYVLDRQKDFVVRHDGSFATRPIEDAFHRHPDVLEAAAFGVPARDDGEEELVACVVLGAGADLDDVVSTVRTSLPRGFPLHQVRVVDYLPRTATGKVVKHLLR